MNTLCGYILGASLLLQAIPNQYSRTHVRNLDVTDLPAPLYQNHQARELLGNKLTSKLQRSPSSTSTTAGTDNSLALAIYIDSQVRALLPDRYEEQARAIAKSIIETANQYAMDPLFLMAVIKQESRFRPNAVGSAGEIGLMQVKPSTAQWLIEQGLMLTSQDYSSSEEELNELRRALKDPALNIAFGAAYLAYLRSSFKGRGPLYLAAYNMGTANLRSHLRTGKRPKIYSDLIVNNYRAFSIDFHRTTLREARAQRVTLTHPNETFALQLPRTVANL